MILKKLRLHQQVWEGCFVESEIWARVIASFFASSYVKHTQSSRREGCQQLGTAKLKGIKSGKKFPIHFVLLPEVGEAAAASLQCGLVKAGRWGMRASFPTMQWACRIGPPAAQRLC